MDNIEKIDLDNVDWQSSREFFESLGEALDKLDEKDESYNFTWVGKRKSIIEAGAPISKTLRPDVAASKDFNNTENMLIVGDNLDALKLLQESYLGKVKMIYIDPPYNTGHDFVYHDNFTVKKNEYKDDSVDEEGNVIVSEDNFAENSKANGRFHSDWLSMIYPRLKLARNLLSDDGVIFISIDDNEQANLKKVCDEVFGEENFIAQFIRRTINSGKHDSGAVATFHEYILCYARNISQTVLADKIKDETERRRLYKLVDEYVGERGRHYITQLNKNSLQYSDSLNYPVVGPDGIDIWPGNGPDDKVWIWRWSQQKVDWGIRNGYITFKKSGDKYKIYTKSYEYKDKDGNDIKRSNPYSTLEFADKRYANFGATPELEKLFNGKKYFDFPKTTSLIIEALKMGNTNNALVLDFFAGSGTTGHAVMDLNAEDGGNRKYILVQLPEPTSEKSEARKAGYETIDQITAERLRRAGEKVQKEHPDAKVDTGFRVFRVDSTNEKDDIRKPLSEIEQSKLFEDVDNIKKDRTPLDLLFGVICVSALPLDLKLEVRHIGENTVYLYGYLDEGTGLVACFDDNISEETVKEIAKLKALTAAFKDSSFSDSAAKINLSEHFRIISPETKVKVI